MAVGNVERGLQEFDGRKQFVGVIGVFAHDDPFIGGKRAGFEQNSVGHAHLADVVEQRASLDVHQVLGVHPQALRHPDGQLGDPLGVPGGLLVLEVERVRPTLDRAVVRKLQFDVRALQRAEQLRALDRDRPLVRERLEELEPLAIGHERAAGVQLDHALQLPFVDMGTAQ